MTKSINMILMPLLVVSYIFGLRIVNLSGHTKLWFNILYMLLIWSIYYFFSTSALMFFFEKFHPIEDKISFRLEIGITLLTIVFGVYYDKKFRNCLQKLNIVDSTLLELGTVTDYNNLHIKTWWIVLGWIMLILFMNFSSTLYVKNKYNCNVEMAVFYIFILNHCFHLNFIGDLTTASILNYIGLKFDQTNEHLQHLIKNNKHKKKQDWKNPMMYPDQCRFSKTLNRKCVIWIVIHLHLELRKISNEIDSIFGTQMTFKMACYFGWMVTDLREILCAILINNYIQPRIIGVIINIIWFSHNVFKFLLINYMCETISTKASVTIDSLNRLLNFNYDVEIREIISPYSLRITYAPLRFYGVGLFQFGYKFLQKFIMSIATVLVIIIQAHANK
ncbi:uncharacterized protein LOC114253850 [Monomorium pharaonis]|uniref:uncharacterized protein LOC114253850 n=1 Tax=Monomorium pharaonis TaxID=307658 RepID=UPI0017463419|nr:uncharacterized protein LOC114253850 [Monomorium pharaonis]